MDHQTAFLNQTYPSTNTEIMSSSKDRREVDHMLVATTNELTADGVIKRLGHEMKGSGKLADIHPHLSMAPAPISSTATIRSRDETLEQDLGVQPTFTRDDR